MMRMRKCVFSVACTALGPMIFPLLLVSSSVVAARCIQLREPALPRELVRDLMVAFPCDREVGIRVVDESGAGFHGHLRGAHVSWDDSRGRVLHFQGQRDHVVVPELQLGTFSYAAWVKTDTRDLENVVLMQLAGEKRILSIQGNAQGSMGLAVTPGRGVNDQDWPFAARQWCHVCVSYDGETVIFYRNGTLLLQRALKNRLPIIGPLTIGGSRQKQGHSWKGSMDDIFLFNRLLEADEVKQLYHMGRDLPVSSSLVDRDEFIIEAFVDDISELHILPDLVYWTNCSKYAKPGRRRNRNEATWINGRPWRPQWSRNDSSCGQDISTQYGLTIEPKRYAPELVAVGRCRDDQGIERGCVKARRDGQSLILRFEDLQSGARWYRVRLYPWQYLDPIAQTHKPRWDPRLCRDRAPSSSPDSPSVQPHSVSMTRKFPQRSVRSQTRHFDSPRPVEPRPHQTVPVPRTPEVTTTPVISMPPRSMVIDAYVDDVSDLWIKDDGLVWKNVTAAAKPGRGDRAHEPTWINGYPWYPKWLKADQDRGIDISELQPHPLPLGFYQAELLAVGHRRGAGSKEGGVIETITLPESLVVRFDDPYRTPRWYRILVTSQEKGNR